MVSLMLCFWFIFNPWEQAAISAAGIEFLSALSLSYYVSYYRKGFTAVYTEVS
ncbi:hypothetical protein H633G_11280 [Metarhizium anisopliae BRIP 53284]|nr:hypothetical protein H633G_11280 [Metarhizium anisopliae BRIP 53284]